VPALPFDAQRQRTGVAAMSNVPSNQNSFVDRAIATITEAAGPHRDEWSPYDHDVINQARDADAEIERLRAALTDAAETFFHLGQRLHMAGAQRVYVYKAKRIYELLGSVPDAVIAATSDSDDEESPAETGAPRT
jgi:hypothetical protein